MEGLAENRLQEITQLLREWAAGDQHALEQATELVYAELRRIAAAYLSQERSSHTLQPTALIHEAYLRLARIEPTNFDQEQRDRDSESDAHEDELQGICDGDRPEPAKKCVDEGNTAQYACADGRRQAEYDLGHASQSK